MLLVQAQEQETTTIPRGDLGRGHEDVVAIRRWLARLNAGGIQYWRVRQIHIIVAVVRVVARRERDLEDLSKHVFGVYSELIFHEIPPNCWL